MGVSFEIHGYDRKDLMNFNRVYVKMGPVRRWLFPLLRAVLPVLSVILIALSGLLLVFGEATVGKTLFYWGAIILGVLTILVLIFYRRIFGWGCRRRFLKGLGTIRVTLDETGITEVTDKSRTVCSYDVVVQAVYYRDVYYLFLDKHHVLLLPVSDMTQGTPQELEALWERMRGEIVRHL